MDVRNASLNHSFEHEHYLTPDSSLSHLPNNVETINCINGDAPMPCVNLDNFDFALPPTPESSHHSCSEYDDTFSSNKNFSTLPDEISSITNLLNSPVDLDLMKSQTCCNTTIKEGFEGNVPNGLEVEELCYRQLCENHVPFENEKEETGKYGLPRKEKCSADKLDVKLDDSVKKKENVPKKIPVNKSCGKKSRASNILQFPPCVICSGKATGSHYGAITCEACKGFFRRHLQKKTEFKCTKGGNCEIVSIKKGICSGCRLKKCLDLGMSKEKSKMGRYTLTKRTEAIMNMNMREGKQFDDSSQIKENEVTFESEVQTSSLSEENSILITHLLKGPKSLNLSGGFNHLLVNELVKCLTDYEPYGPNIKTKEEIAQAHRAQYERYKQKIELFGEMKTISKEEYNDIYTQFGIDIDGRLADLKLDCEDLDTDMSFYCDFAKHIPEFHNFSLQDQVSLLNTLMMDFFIVTNLDCYSDEYQTFIVKSGHGYHYEELAGREYSKELMALSKKMYCRLQMLNLSTEERALMAALALVSSDRCKLQNRALVEKVQLSLTELMQTYIKKEAGTGRFTKIIDTLTYMRELSDLHRKESNELCKDEVLQKEFPLIKEFFIKENY